MHELRSFPLDDRTVLLAEMAQLRKENRALRVRVAELEARLNKDSHNASKPPASDSPYRKPQPKSLRQPSGRVARGVFPQGIQGAVQ